MSSASPNFPAGEDRQLRFRNQPKMDEPTINTRHNNELPTDDSDLKLDNGKSSIAQFRQQVEDISTGTVAAANAAYHRGKHAFEELGVNWPIVIWIGVVHVLAIIAPFFFSWPALLTCILLAFVTGSLGVCMGYHRLLTHQSFKTYRPIRWMLAFLGGLSGEGSALTWVAQHRKHHAFSDDDGDPHSPVHGAWWSHMLWFMPDFGRKWHHELLKRYAPDMFKDRMMVVLHYLFLPSHLMMAGILYLMGYFGPESWGLGSAWAGGSMVFWGLGVRMVYVLHVTWLVNSATHLWGYRNYETSDNSRNLWWVGILAWGEGWHNNHHAYQRVASQGHRWWEIDVTYYMIWVMEKVGLAWDVVRLKDMPKAAA